MKKMFSLINQVFIEHGKHLIIVFCALVFVNSLYAEEHRYAKVEAQIHPSSTGVGKVYVDGANVEANGEAEVIGASATAVGKSSSKTSGETDINFTLTAEAKASDNSYFDGWTKDKNSLTIENTNSPYSFSVRSSETSDNPSVSETWYAVFKNIITISPTTTEVVLIKGASGISPVKYNVTVHNGELSYTIAGGESSKFTVNMTDNGSGNYELQISAIASATTDDTEMITLTGGGASVVLNVSIEETSTITLKPGENGTYTYYQPALGMTADNAILVTSTLLPIMITQTEGFSFVLTPTANTGYRFDRWRIENGESVRYSLQQPYDGLLNKNDVVTPEFIDDKYAQFIIVGETPQVYYNHLEDAIAKAQTSANKTIAVYQSGILPSDNYTIPEGITLLVPGDDNYTCRTSSEGLLDEDYSESSAGTLKKKLTLSDNTTITVNGNICIYAQLQLITAGLKKVRPNTYGQLEMGENCHIILETTGATKAGLFAYGYITNRDDQFRENCTITAKSGSIVYEQFLVTDYRGGRGTTGMIGNSSDVFPMCQYYVNSIEPKLILEYGSEEWLTTGMDLNGSMIANSIFLVPNTNEYTNGFFRLGAGTKLIKYYDATEDRQKFILKGESKTSEVQLANIALTLGGYDVNSAEYVLPLAPNMDVECKSVKVTIKEDLAMIAGSSVKIDAESEVVVASDARLFVYDRGEYEVYQPETKHNNLKLGWYNYFGAGNGYVHPLTYRIGNKSQKYNRETKDFTVNSATLNPEHYHENAAGTANVYTALPKKSATITVNGKLSGPIYTTVGGACITSEAGGEVMFTTTTSTSLYQVLQYAGDKGLLGTPQNLVYHSIGNTVAQLYNADGSYSAGTAAQVGDTYIYYPNLENTDGSKGRWEKPFDGISAHTPLALKITLPTQSFVEGIVECTLTQPAGAAPFKAEAFKVVSDNSSFVTGTMKIEDGKLIIPVTYNSQDKHGEYTANLTVSNLAIDLTYPLTVTATEYYRPEFSAPTPNPFTSTVEVPVSSTLPIALTEDNVTTIWNNATYGSRMVWEPTVTGTNAEDFSFVWGEGENKFSEAKVVFTPKSEGQNKSATLTLKATYTDGKNGTKDSILVIPLSGNANLNPNTLKFATPPEEISIDTEAFPLFVEGSDNAKTPITITIDPSSIGEVQLSGSGENTMITPKKAGVVIINVQQNASISIAKFEGSLTLTINEPAALTPLTVCFDEMDIFKTHTKNAKSIAFDDANDMVSFTSTATENSQWTLIYEGVADKIEFTPNGTNQWRIEEATSIENNDWTNVAPWQFYENTRVELPLKPTSTAIRITYANGESVGTLTNVCISKLEITSNLQKMYLPVNTDNTESSATIIFTHTDLDIAFTNFTELELMPTPSDNLGSAEYPYYTTTLQVKTNAFTEIDKVYSLTATTALGTKTIQIRTYENPQELPIKLKTDDPERYYFITTASANAQWNAANRQVVFQNTTLVRSVTFSFHGAPSIVKFDLYNALGEAVNIVSEDWVIEGYDGTKWNTASEVNRIIDGNSLEQEVLYNWQQIRITYKSTNASEVRLSNLVIEGYPQLIASPEALTFTSESTEKQLILTAINLSNITITSDNGTNFKLIYDPAVGEVVEINANSTLFPEALGVNLADTILLTVVWEANNTVDEGTITITNDNQNDSVLAVVKLLGAKDYIYKDNATETGVFTGLAPNYTLHGAAFNDYTYHEVDFTNTFSNDGVALFDYLIVYGVTTTTDETTNVTAPNSQKGSNAKTPYYIYAKAPNGEGVYNCYQFVEAVENANVSDKAQTLITTKDDAGSLFIDVQDSLRVYMTGFCPYATTGYSKEQEGVWFFRGESGEKLDIYLEDCFIFSRNKTQGGHSFRDRNDVTSPAFTGKYVQGSGAVFTFENTTYHETQTLSPFDVNIHTRGTNVFKSTHGCFFQLIEGWRAFQISSPIQVHMASDRHVRSNASKTSLTFDDLWPVEVTTAVVDEKEVTTYEHERTNGFISLQKQTNNAPSIDLGAPSTEVNFRGGRVELQNAQIVSTNYKTTLAISYRSGEMGGEDVGFHMAYGIGTDSVGGTVNFYDGTITVLPMKVAQEYRQYYLMDTLPDGTESEYTSCLRCPQQTYVYGGSICRIRACMHVTSKGGAPTDGPDANAKPLGQYVYSAEQGYTYQCGDNTSPACKLVTLNQFPNGSLFNGLPGYYGSRPYTTYGAESNMYGTQSITPDENGNVYLWIPDGYAGVEAEEDKLMRAWRACMTEITAGMNSLKGTVGGETYIDPNEEVQFMLYCELDNNIKEVITRKDGDIYLYNAPVKVPSPLNLQLGDYMEIPPIYVGEELQNEIVTSEDYTIKDRVYYVTTATADIWKTFTAPFDVAKIYVVESYSETALATKGTRAQILKEQAKHNADFAAFFGVAMAIGTTEPFETIFEEFREWAKMKDQGLGLYNPTTDGTYNLRNMQELVPYYGKNWRDANFYLNHNDGNWILTQTQDSFAVQWSMLPDTAMADGILLHKGETYSMMFPYCPGCETSLNDREYWDYWSGKFLIFESTDAAQTINGRDFLKNTLFNEVPGSNEVRVTGNSTFAFMDAEGSGLYVYSSDAPSLNKEKFMQLYDDESEVVTPTTAFLYGNVPTNAQGMPARSIGRTGKINYGKENTSTDVNPGGNIPTVGGGNDLFITSTVEGINIAVAEPQHVRVLSSTGAVLYSGMVQTAVDVALPTTGVYVITGENEVHKILH